MLTTARTFAALLLACAILLASPLTAAAPTGKPEDVGLSSERLKRVAELVQRHITAGSFSGAVTLIARNGRIAYHEAQGVMDRSHAYQLIMGAARRPRCVTIATCHGKART